MDEFGVEILLSADFAQSSSESHENSSQIIGLIIAKASSYLNCEARRLAHILSP
jgi:hypothetical protein